MSPDVEGLLRELSPQVLGVLCRRYGDVEACEDAVQEALLAAHQHWTDGVPEQPRGWLIQTATRKLIDAARSDTARRTRETAYEPAPPDVPDADDSLVLLFLCCHPVLTPASAIALTLRAVGGLTTAQIARAFLVPEATMAQRISRAKMALRTEDFTLPPNQRDRLRNVLHVLYLMFNEGYGDLARIDLVDEAVRLARMVHRLLPDDPETAGLLALMLLTDARRPARLDAASELVPMAEQDRTRWDRAMIAEGTALLDPRRPGDYQLQAAIAGVHSTAARAEDTDWPRIAALYGLLEAMTGSQVVALNRVVATAMAFGAPAGLALLDTVRLDGHRVDAVRAHLLELSGDRAAAREHYLAAAAATTSLREQRHLTSKAASLA